VILLSAQDRIEALAIDPNASTFPMPSRGDGAQGGAVYAKMAYPQEVGRAIEEVSDQARDR
jgi:hypothetical protein